MSRAPYPKLDDWLQDVSEVARQPLETVTRYRDQLIPHDRRIFGLPVDRIDRAEPVNAPKGELTMDYIDWVTEHSPLATPDKAVIAEPPKSRLFSRTFHEAELVSLAKLATWLGVGSRPLLEAAQGRATIQGAVPPTPFVSGSPPQFYFWLSEVHQAWPMNGHTPVSERRPLRRICSPWRPDKA